MFEAYSRSNREGLIAASRIEKEARIGSKAVDRDRTQGLPVHFGEPTFSKIIQTVSYGPEAIIERFLAQLARII